jgi:hypothetical protein
MSKNRCIVVTVLGVAAAVMCACLGGCMLLWIGSRLPTDTSVPVEAPDTPTVRPTPTRTPTACRRLYGDGRCQAYCENYHTFNLEHGGQVTFSWTQSTPGRFLMDLEEVDGNRTWMLEPGTIGHWVGEATASLPAGDYRLVICCDVGTEYDVTITECPK